MLHDDFNSITVPYKLNFRPFMQPKIPQEHEKTNKRPLKSAYKKEDSISKTHRIPADTV